MGHSDTEWIWILVLFFGTIGFIVPFIQLEFGGTVATYDIESVGQATGTGIINAITSILFWTFGVPVWLNIIVFIPLRALMWFIIFKQGNPFSSGT